MEEYMNVEMEQEEMLDTEKVSTLFWLNKEENFIVVQISPASRVAIGEYFGLSHGEDGIGKVAAILRELGADAVVDTAIAEDAVAILETKKLLAHKKNGGNTPLFASRCAAFVAAAKEKYPTLCMSDLPATAVVCGALVKEFYREQTGKRVFVIAVEPCRAHKELRGVDLVLTTEELVSILAETEINVRLEEKEALDVPFGVSSGSAYICGISGGIADSIARCLSADKSQEALRKFSYSGLYGEKKLREATLKINGETWKFAVVCGMQAAEELMSRVANGEAAYDYVEVTACDGGCVGGDGQACVINEDESVEYAVKLRAQGLKYIENKRAAKAADMSASATMLARAWSDLARNGGVVDEVIDWKALFVETAIDFLQENVVAVEEDVQEVETSAEAVAEMPIEETVAEELAEEAVEEVVEEVAVAEETAEETAEAVEELSPVEEKEETPKVESVAEVCEAEALEMIEEVATAEETTEEAAEIVEEKAEEATETIEETKEVEDVEDEETDEAQGKAPIDPYHLRLSGRARRKLKRQKKNNK